MNPETNLLESLRREVRELGLLLEIKEAEYQDLRHKRNALALAVEVLANDGAIFSTSSNEAKAQGQIH